MKDEFDIIDLDCTDTIPSGSDLEEELWRNRKQSGAETDNTVEYVDEDYADEDFTDEDLPHFSENENSGRMKGEKTAAPGMENTENPETEEFVDEDYDADAEPILADVKLMPEEENDTALDVHSPDVFQGEVSMDPSLLQELYAEGDDAEYAQDDAEYAEGDDAEYAQDDAEYAEGDDVEYAQDDAEYAEGDDAEYAEDDDLDTPDEDLEFMDDEQDGGIGAAEFYERTPGTKSKQKKKKKHLEEKESFRERILDRLRDFSAFDWAITGMGAVIVIVAIVVFFVYRGTKQDVTDASAVYALGSRISEMGIAGESGLLAVTDAAALKALPSEEPAAEETPDNTVSANEIDTVISFTSVEQDLKIKFVNKETDRLITNVAFEVHLKDKKDKETVLKDEDLDGIIYEKPMKSGEYTVEVTPVEGYHFISYENKIKVKEKITYEQIDVKQEIKTEAEVNVSKEDTAVNVAEQEKAKEEATEEKLADTVEWVESTRTPIEGGSAAEGYSAVDKSTINEPAYNSGRALTVENEKYSALRPAITSWRILTRSDVADSRKPVLYKTEDSDPLTEPTAEELPLPEVSEQPSEQPTETPAKTPSPEPTAVPEEPSKEPGIEPTKAPTETPTEVPTEAPTAAPEVTPSPEPTKKPDASPSPSPSIAPTQKPESSKIDKVTLGESSITLAPGVSKKLIVSAKLKDKSILNDAELFYYESSDTKIAEVDEEGVVTGIKEGKCKVTVTFEDDFGNRKSASCSITVSSLKVLEVTLKKKELVLMDGHSESLEATARMSDNSKITDAAKFQWESSNTDVVTVKAGEVTAKKEGTATITVSYTDGAGSRKEASCSVKVTKSAQGDTTSKLKDKNGNQIYIKDSSGKYVEATYADYYTASEYYIKTEVKYKYTGWQTIDGNVYFYDKNNNKVTGDQVIQGVKYHFTSEGILAMDKNGRLGIDVSKWNGNIDWNAVKNSGITYVIIRCGYRGSSSGVLVEDPTFKSNIKGAKAAGLKVGVYFFTQAVNEVEAVEEASMCLSLVKGYGLSYPIFIDTEKANGRADGIDKATRTAVCRAFCETIKSGGYTPGIYASKYWFYDNLNYNNVSAYRIWLAQYTSEPSFSHRYDLWQYSSKGSVSGIKGNVDMNWSYLGY